MKFIEIEIPEYKTMILSQKKCRYCICIFVINEGDRIRAQIAKLSNYTHLVDVIIADGGSTDNSLDQDFLRKNNISALLTKTSAGKLSAQMRMGFDYAIKTGYAGVIVADGNNKDDMSAIPNFIQSLENGYDHIQGSRYIEGGVEENTPLLRKYGVKYIHAPLISIASGQKSTDTTNGFRAYSMKLLTHPEVLPFRSVFMSYELHYYLSIRSSQLGFKCCEIPVTRSYPKDGPIPSKIKGIRGNFIVLLILIKACLGFYNP